METARRLGVGNATTEYQFLDNYQCAAPRHAHTPHAHPPCTAAAACQQRGSMQP